MEVSKLFWVVSTLRILNPIKSTILSGASHESRISEVSPTAVKPVESAPATFTLN